MSVYQSLICSAIRGICDSNSGLRQNWPVQGGQPCCNLNNGSG